MVRLLRLIKLFRILRASRIFARWEGAISISYAHRELIKWIAIVMLLIHWLAWCAPHISAKAADFTLAAEPCRPGGARPTHDAASAFLVPHLATSLRGLPRS